MKKNDTAPKIQNFNYHFNLKIRRKTFYVLRIKRKPIKETLSQNQDSINGIKSVLHGQNINQNSKFLNNTMVNCTDKMANTFTNLFYSLLKAN